MMRAPISHDSLVTLLCIHYSSVYGKKSICLYYFMWYGVSCQLPLCIADQQAVSPACAYMDLVILEVLTVAMNHKM